MLSPLHNAILEDQLEAVMLLIDNGADINAKTHLGDDSLHLAVYKNNEDMVELLLSYDNVDIISEDDGGYIPLDVAIDNNNRYIIDILIDKMKEVIILSRE